MRLYEFIILNEGGNIFRDENKVPVTVRINKADVDPTLKWLEPIVNLNLVDHKLGTTGKRESSGDLDIAVDQDKVSKDDIVNSLTQWVETNKPGEDLKAWIRKSGINVHFKTPINGDESQGYVQTDLMFGDPKWLSFQMTGLGEDTEFKGMHRAILISSIAKQMGMKFSSAGLTDRESGEVITRDPTKVAQTLLGGTGTVDDLEDVDKIVAKLRATQPSEYEGLVADARETFARDGLTLP